MNKVFIVTRNNYDNYGVEACFSTQEKADEYMELCEQDEFLKIEAGVEVFTLDTRTSEQEVVTEWKCWIDYTTGKIEDHMCHKWLVNKAEQEKKHPGFVSDYTKRTAWGGKINTHRGGQATSYVSKEHVVELAKEARRIWLSAAHLRIGNKET